MVMGMSRSVPWIHSLVSQKGTTNLQGPTQAHACSQDRQRDSLKLVRDLTYDHSANVVERHSDLNRPLAFRKDEGTPSFVQGKEEQDKNTNVGITLSNVMRQANSLVSTVWIARRGPFRALRTLR